MAATIPTVLVTGASGYIALHIVHQLLEAGWNVRATVRDPANEKKCAPLKELATAAHASDRLELVKADLLQPAEAWSPIVKGCDYVLHTASPFVLDGTSREKLIEPAVTGTTNVVQACIDEPAVRRLVVTASCATIGYGHKGGLGSKVWTPEDWTQYEPPAKVGGYVESKARAERAAWDLIKAQPADRKLELVTIHPSLVQGPTLSKSGATSVELSAQILLGKMPGLPNSYMNTVDVADVARAHIRALTVKDAAGKRFILGQKEVSMSRFGEIISEKFAPIGYKPTTGRLSNWVLWVASWFDSTAAELYPDLGQHFEVDNSATTDILGIKFRDIDASIVETLESGIRAGLIPDNTPDKRYTEGAEKAKVIPEVVVEGIRPSDIEV